MLKTNLTELAIGTFQGLFTDQDSERANFCTREQNMANINDSDWQMMTKENLVETGGEVAIVNEYPQPHSIVGT